MDHSRSLADTRALLLDMDGVIYYEEHTLPGAREFLDFLRQEGIPFAFVTNGTGSWPEDHRRELARRGIAAEDVPIYTAGMATAEYLARRGPGAKVYLIGEERFRELLAEQGQCVFDDERAEYVVVGWTPDFSYAQLEKAVRLIHRGAQLVVGDPDVNDPAPGGPKPGSGAFAAAIEAATGVQGVRIGKPSRALFEMALRGLSVPARHAAIVGDRLDSDIRGGLEVGIGTILVLTGITTADMLARSPFKPDWVVHNLYELRERWSAELEMARRRQKPGGGNES